jgi:hypothetical protein
MKGVATLKHRRNGRAHASDEDWMKTPLNWWAAAPNAGTLRGLNEWAPGSPTDTFELAPNDRLNPGEMNQHATSRSRRVHRGGAVSSCCRSARPAITSIRISGSRGANPISEVKSALGRGFRNERRGCARWRGRAECEAGTQSRGSEDEMDSISSHLMLSACIILVLELLWIGYSFLSWWWTEMHRWS